MRTDWVASSTWGEMKVTCDSASTVPLPSMIATGVPRRTCAARSTGTLMYASRPVFWSMVVSRVDGRDAVAHVHGHVADDAGGGGYDAVVLELHLLLVHLCVEGGQVGLRGVVGRLRLVEVGLARDPLREQPLHPLQLGARPLERGQLRLAGGFLAAHGRALLERIDLQDRRARLDAIAGPDEDRA